jgi:hypothetical protein
LQTSLDQSFTDEQALVLVGDVADDAKQVAAFVKHLTAKKRRTHKERAEV